MRTSIELSVGTLERTILGCVAAFMGACIVCAGANFVKSSFGSGVSETMRRLGSSSDRMVKYLGPTFERLNSLMDTPEDLGFGLYGENVTYFGNETVIEGAVARWTAEGGVTAMHRREILYTLEKLDTPRGSEIAPVVRAIGSSKALKDDEESRQRLLEAVLLSPKVRTACGNPSETVLKKIAREYPARQIAQQLVSDAGDIASISALPATPRLPTATVAPTATAKPTATVDESALALRRLEEALQKWSQAGGMTAKDVDQAVKILADVKDLKGEQLADLVRRIDASPHIQPNEKISALATLLLSPRVRAATRAQAAQMRDIVDRIPTAVIVAKLNTEPIHRFHTLSQVRVAEATVTPTATAPVKAPPVETGKVLGYNDFLEMERKEALFRNCIHTQGEIDKAFAQFRESKLSPVKTLNLAELKEANFLESIPLCPSGGRFELDENESVRCSYHGSVTDPYEHHAFFQTVFRRYQLQLSAFAAGRYQEVKYQLTQVLKKHPKHLHAIELLGEATFALKEWDKAAQTLYPIAKAYPKDAKTCFHTGFAFYGAGNDVLAKEHLQKVLAATWSTSSRRLVQRRQLYLLQDEARWILDRFLSPPSGNAVRFLEFQVAYRNKPLFPTEICEKNASAARQLLRDFVKNYYDTPTLRKLRKRLEETVAKLAALQPFEQDEIERLKTHRSKIERAIARATGGERSGSMLRDLTAHVRKNPIPPCPAGGRYHVDSHGHFQCSHHPDLLTDATLPAAVVAASPDERAALNRALFHSCLRGGDAKRFTCIETNQRAILRVIANAQGRISPEKGQDLKGLVRQGLLTAAEISCPGGGTYVVEGKGDEARLRCTVHGSHQDYYAMPVEGGP